MYRIPSNGYYHHFIFIFPENGEYIYKYDTHNYEITEIIYIKDKG